MKLRWKIWESGGRKVALNWVDSADSEPLSDLWLGTTLLSVEKHRVFLYIYIYMYVCTYVLDSRHLSACTLPSGFSGCISVWMFSNILIIVLGFYCCLGKSMKDRISEKHTFLNLASHSVQCLLSASCVMGTRWDTAPMVAMAKLQRGGTSHGLKRSPDLV